MLRLSYLHLSHFPCEINNFLPLHSCSPLTWVVTNCHAWIGLIIVNSTGRMKEYYSITRSTQKIDKSWKILENNSKSSEMRWTITLLWNFRVWNETFESGMKIIIKLLNIRLISISYINLMKLINSKIINLH